MKRLYRATRLLNKPGNDVSFATGSNSIYFDQMYERWRKDPASVHASFQAYFENVDKGVANPYQAPPTLGQRHGGNSDQIVQ